MNGNITPLSVDRDSRKDPDGKYFLQTTENIEDVQLIYILGHSYVAMHVKNLQVCDKYIFLSR